MTRTIDMIRLAKGDHDTPEKGLCAMEAAAWLAGEPHSSHPACVCPVIAAFLRNWNDALPYGKRNRFIKPLVPLVIGTRDGCEERRAWMAHDWMVRTAFPAWVREAGLPGMADTLSALPEITGLHALREVDFLMLAIDRTVRAARSPMPWTGLIPRGVSFGLDAAWDAAWGAAADAWDTVWDSVGKHAAITTGFRDAALLSVLDRLDAIELAAPVAALQASAVALVRRMAEIKPVS